MHKFDLDKIGVQNDNHEIKKNHVVRELRIIGFHLYFVDDFSYTYFSLGQASHLETLNVFYFSFSFAGRIGYNN